MAENIHPIFDSTLTRASKEELLRQRAIVVWMVGLSGSGKSTLAKGLELALHQRGHLTQLLDGDNLRSGINNNLGFSDADRLENIRRSAETAKLFLNAGLVTICSLISPTAEIRNMAKNIIGEADFYEVYINAPFEVCAQRDVKGLYKKALNGEIKNFTGLDAPFEEPQNPDLEIRTDQEDYAVSLQKLLDAIVPRITFAALG
ncbi:adenylyl-sulfate kinase [Adhaeribacter pallidiroseus]|uniref:Adenylyl-sulfate kinase n=1 Tax=Adhaeribacter pallidiroseus TaxID=2072847 RepID=A0A369QMJ8_9BACT|nr:adenylyl-sulfate kinase [Adhaeribacter pallidiroseus]RDC64079.1 Adenylyl-sulfate kinase [Adhaeribacter pallidiroseus]